MLRMKRMDATDCDTSYFMLCSFNDVEVMAAGSNHCVTCEETCLIWERKMNTAMNPHSEVVIILSQARPLQGEFCCSTRTLRRRRPESTTLTAPTGLPDVSLVCHQIASRTR